MEKMYISVSFQIEGIHCYPAAPAAVSFLRSEHRHMFFIVVKLEVLHDDRDVEFILLKRELTTKFTPDNFSYKSCEMLAREIADYVKNNYSGRSIKVSVYEDNENGAEYEYEPSAS